MTSYVTPKKGFPFICYVGLVSQSTGQFQSNPTLAAGDFKISKDGGALANLATLPAVAPAASKSVKISLDSDETNADNLVVIGSDAAGAEWDDLFINIQTTVRQIDDLAFPTTSGRSMDVTTTGEVGIDWANIGGPTTVVNLSGTTVKTATDIETDTQDLQNRLPAALSGDGFIKADLLSIGDELVSGNNATLNLKKLNIINSAGDALVAKSTGLDGTGAIFQGAGYGHGFDILGGTNNTGLQIDGGSSLGNAIQINSYGDATETIVIENFGTGGNTIGIYSDGGGKSINAPQDIALPSGDLDDQLQSIITEVTPLTFDSDNYVLSHPSTPLTVTTNNDKTGYSLTSAYDPAKTASQDSDMAIVLANVVPLTFDSDNYVLSHPMTSVVVGTNNDKSNYTLTSAYDASKTASQDSDMFDVLSYVTHLTFDSDDKVFANAAVSLTSDDIDQIVNALSFPTANENATTLLKYDWNTITGEADRSVLNALRKLRNKVSFSGGTLSIKKEDDLTNAYTQAVTQDSDQEPFKSVG